MIVRLRYQIDLPESLRTQNISSSLHGVLMELLPKSVVDDLHQLEYDPLRQRLFFDKGKTIWEIVGLHDLVSNNLKKLDDLNNIVLKHDNCKLPLAFISKEFVNSENLVKTIMDGNKESRYINLNFISPTTFKSEGAYDIFPDIRKIFRSIMINFDFFNDKTKIYDYEVLKYIEKQVKIVDYKLSTRLFYLEKTRIKGFKGTVKIKINGAAHFVKLINLILFYAEYSGIGAKTSLGMGGFRIERHFIY